MSGVGAPAGRPAKQPSPPHKRLTRQSKLLAPAQLAGSAQRQTAAVVSPPVSVAHTLPAGGRLPFAHIFAFFRALHASVTKCFLVPHPRPAWAAVATAGGRLPKLRTPPDPTQGLPWRPASPAPYPPDGAHSDVAYRGAPPRRLSPSCGDPMWNP